MKQAASLTQHAPAPQLGPVLEFMCLILAVDHGLQKASRRLQGSTGVTGPQSLVIRIVGRFPGIPAGHLARLLHVHPSTMTRMLDRLEGQRLIRRRPDPRDRRRSFLGLTAGGRQIDAAVAGTVEAALESAITGMAPGRIQIAGSVLGQVAASLDRGNQPLPGDGRLASGRPGRSGAGTAFVTRSGGRVRRGDSKSPARGRRA